MSDNDSYLDQEGEEQHLEDAFEDEASEPEHANIPAATKKILAAAKKDPNLVTILTAAELSDVKMRVSSGFDMDLESMTEYLERYKKITDLAAMKTDKGDKTFPFVGAAKTMMQELAQAAIELQSRMVPDIVNRRDIMNVYKWGQPDAQKEAKAERL